MQSIFDRSAAASANVRAGTRQVLDNGLFALYFDCWEFDGDLDVERAFETSGLEGCGLRLGAVLAPALKKRDKKP